MPKSALVGATPRVFSHVQHGFQVAAAVAKAVVGTRVLFVGKWFREEREKAGVKQGHPKSGFP